jgi:glycolate oxidase iron-sulfur subunit
MLGLHEGKIEATDSVRQHLDLCLDCRACETACPSNVVYHELIEEARAKLPPAEQSTGDRIVRWMFLHVLTRPGRLKAALLPARLLQKVGIYPLLRRTGLFNVLPAGLAKMEGMLPDSGRLLPRKLPAVTPPLATSKTKVVPKTTVAFFAGCIGSVMFDRVNQQAVDLLAAAGCLVVVPVQSCCGAIHHHNGLHAQSVEMAKRTIDAIERTLAGRPGQHYIVSTVAGCGAMLRDYATLLRDDITYASKATAFATKVRDITELLAEIGLPTLQHRVEHSVTYHDACHLVHAQKVGAQPRALLAQVPGLTLVPLAESDMCCGAAGTYNLTQPEMASALAGRKLSHIAATGAEICVTGNVGCALHIQAAGRSAGKTVRVLHPVEILHEAVFGTSSPPPAVASVSKRGS